jgi:hypothetical protein
MTIPARRFRTARDSHRTRTARIGVSCLRSSAPEPGRGRLKRAAKYGFSLYDALTEVAALDAECTTFYPEDLQNGQVIEAGHRSKSICEMDRERLTLVAADYSGGLPHL